MLSPLFSAVFLSCFRCGLTTLPELLSPSFESPPPLSRFCLFPKKFTFLFDILAELIMTVFLLFLLRCLPFSRCFLEKLRRGKGVSFCEPPFGFPFAPTLSRVVQVWTWKLSTVRDRLCCVPIALAFLSASRWRTHSSGTGCHHQFFLLLPHLRLLSTVSTC